MHQKISPHTMTPTISEAMTTPTQKCRLWWASGVMPSGHPRPSAWDQLQPLRLTAARPSTPTSVARFSHGLVVRRCAAAAGKPVPRSVTVGASCVTS